LERVEHPDPRISDLHKRTATSENNGEQVFSGEPCCRSVPAFYQKVKGRGREKVEGSHENLGW
jgi:hypothetical protein